MEVETEKSDDYEAKLIQEEKEIQEVILSLLDAISKYKETIDVGMKVGNDIEWNSAFPCLFQTISFRISFCCLCSTVVFVCYSSQIYQQNKNFVTSHYACSVIIDNYVFSILLNLL